MKCDRCGVEINTDEAMEARGQTVCEECYIDLMAKPKTCDPWAVYSAKNLVQNNFELTEKQREIVYYLENNGPTPPEQLSRDLQLSPEDFERLMAPLRHMEKVRAELQDGRKVICLW